MLFRLYECLWVDTGLAVDWKMIQIIPLFLLLNHFRYGLEYFIVVGPLSGNKFWVDEYIVDVNLKWTYSWEDDLLIIVFVYEHIFFIFILWSFYQLIRYWVLNNNRIIHKFFDLAFYFVIYNLR